MRVLIVDDDPILSLQIKHNLESQTFAVDTTDNGEDGSYMARINDYDIIVLDDVLPKKNGFVVCKEIRNANKNTPIIAISETSDIRTKVNIFREGADDHLIKPFSLDELTARIQAVLRRPPLQHRNILTIEDISLDCVNQEVIKGVKKIYLTRKEFALLEYLMRNIGTVVSRGMIMEHVWDNSADPFSNTIESHILNLRRKIDFKNRLIHNIPGRGYKIDTRK